MSSTADITDYTVPVKDQRWAHRELGRVMVVQGTPTAGNVRILPEDGRGQVVNLHPALLNVHYRPLA